MPGPAWPSSLPIGISAYAAFTKGTRPGKDAAVANMQKGIAALSNKLQNPEPAREEESDAPVSKSPRRQP